MLISVVIPTYNRLSILKKCLDALENQSLKVEIHDFEIVIVDDGSTDGTVDLSLIHISEPTRPY